MTTATAQITVQIATRTPGAWLAFSANKNYPGEINLVTTVSSYKGQISTLLQNGETMVLSNEDLIGQTVTVRMPAEEYSSFLEAVACEKLPERAYSVTFTVPANVRIGNISPNQSELRASILFTSATFEELSAAINNSSFGSVDEVRAALRHSKSVARLERDNASVAYQSMASATEAPVIRGHALQQQHNLVA